jgi:hypothetical protein
MRVENKRGTMPVADGVAISDPARSARRHAPLTVTIDFALGKATTSTTNLKSV